MKLKYILGVILSALLFVGCSEDEGVGSLAEIQLDKTFAIFTADSGDVQIVVKANTDWEFIKHVQVGTHKDDNGNTVKDYDFTPTWLTVDKLTGTKGETTITLHAKKSENGRETELAIKAGNKTQFILVRQGSLDAAMATCAEILAGSDGKTYRTKGVCTSIANTEWGNWYINDGSGKVYIYGTLDDEGKEMNFLSLGIEVGDVVEIEGPRSTYNDEVELVNVTVIKIEKSLLKITSEYPSLDVEGGEFTIKTAYKGNGVAYQVEDESMEWISCVQTQLIPGTPSKLEPIPADTMIYTFKATENTGKSRQGSIKFTSANLKGSSFIDVPINQAGVTGTLELPFCISEAIEYVKNNPGESTKSFYIKGKVSKIVSQYSEQNGNGTFWISEDGVYNNDKSLDFEVYQALWLNNEAWKEGNCPISVGDEVIMYGKITSYNGTAETSKGNAYVYSVNGVTTDANGLGNEEYPFTVAGAIESANAGYRGNAYVEGVISKVVYTFSAKYGTATFWMSQDGVYNDDKTKDFEAYSIYSFNNTPWAEGGKQIAEGDNVTVYGEITLYNGLAETNNKKAWLFQLNGEKE